jgi:asparagine synthase (glutamine-hydrolysing)
LLQRLTGALGGLRSVLSPGFLHEFRGYDVYRAFYQRCDEEAGISAWQPARQLTYLWLRSLFVNYHLAADRLDMAHGVEVRLPFLDHVLFEYAQQLPLPVLAGQSREKHLLREAVRRYIPDSVYERSKKPFWAPPRAASGINPLSELVQDTLRSDVMTSVPFVDRREVLKLLDGLPGLEPAAQTSMDSLLLVLTSLCALQERYRL